MDRDIDYENICRYGDRWHLLREDIAAGLAAPIPEAELAQLDADLKKLEAEHGR